MTYLNIQKQEKISEFEYLMITIPSSYYSKNANEILQDYSVNNIGIYDIEKADENLLGLAETKGKIIEYKPDIQNNVSLPDYKITSIETKAECLRILLFLKILIYLLYLMVEIARRCQENGLIQQFVL